MYKFFLTLHILAVVVGIGSNTLNGVYAAKAKKLGGAAQGAVMRVNFDVSMLAEKIVYLIPIFGFILMAIPQSGQHPWKFGQTWIWLSLVLYVVAIGIVHGVMVPGAKRLQALGQKLAGGEGAPQDGAEVVGTEQRVAIGVMVLNLLLVVLIALMIWKPGV